jgi:hypothetical protein
MLRRSFIHRSSAPNTLASYKVFAISVQPSSLSRCANHCVRASSATALPARCSVSVK